MWYICHIKIIFVSLYCDKELITIKTWGQHGKFCDKRMRTISENKKYPEFKEEYKGGKFITGHLVRMDDMYYLHSKRVVTEYSYDELPEIQKSNVEAFEQKQIELAAEMVEVACNLRACNALVEWAKVNCHRMERSNQSESKYYYIRHTDGRMWKIRVSGHRYPTGSMTNMMLGVIDTTDGCCVRYCELLGIEF